MPVRIRWDEPSPVSRDDGSSLVGEKKTEFLVYFHVFYGHSLRL